MHLRELIRVVRYAMIIITLIIYLFPIYWIFVTAFKRRIDIFALPPRWIFTPTLDNLYEVINSGMIYSILNSAIITGISVIISIILSTLAAYGFSRYDFKGKDLWLFYIISTRMMPPIVVVIPIYIMFSILHLKGTYIGLITMYTVMNIAFGTWIMKGFVDEVPKDIDEAAEIDGYPKWKFLLKVLLPIIRPGLTATIILMIIFVWNEFLFALLLSSTNTRPASVALASIRGERGFNWGRVAMLETIYILPVIILVFLVQKHLLRAMTFGTVRE